MSKPAITTEGGNCLAFPDTCHLPAPPPPAGPGGIPTPYPNKFDNMSAKKTTKKVKFNKKKVCTQGSKTSRSMGDEAGCSNLPTPKGLMSMKNMHEGEYKGYSSKVKAENKGLVRLLDSTSHNGGGNDNQPMGKALVPSQVKIIAN